MSWELIKQEIGTKRAGEDMTAARGKAVVFNGLDRVQISGLAGPFAGQVHGILANNPASGGVATVQVFGVAMARLGGAVLGGRYVDVDANGDLIENHPDGQVGIALEAGIAGSVVPVFLVNRTFAAGSDGVVISATLVGDTLTLGRSAALGDVTVDLSQYDDTVIVAVAQAAADAAQLAADSAQSDIDAHILSVGNHADIDLAGQTDGQILRRVGGVWVPSNEAEFGEYVGVFDASIGTFPGSPTINQGDWFNTGVGGTVDGETFVPGDLLVAAVDNPSTVTFAANWVRIPNLSITDHDFLANNGGAGSHATIDNRLDALELQVKSMTFENPIGPSEILTWFYTDVEITVQQINYVVSGPAATQVDVSIQFSAVRNAVGTELTVGGETISSVAGGQEVTSFDNAAIPAGSWVTFRTSSPINTPTEIHASMVYI